MTLDCLQTLQKELEELEREIWVVDNASRDGSVEAVREQFPDVRIIASGSNLGFGAANNLAMQQACGDLILLLNSDAFPRPNAIRALIETMDSHPEAGVVGPRLLNKDGSLQLSCFRFPTPVRCWLENLWLSAAFHKSPILGDYRRWDHNEERCVDSIVGACMLVRSRVFKQVGGFDETFFMYSEETDWQRRITDMGWKIAFTPMAEVVHLGGSSGENDRTQINNFFFESLDYYVWKHHGLTGLVSVRAAMVVGCFMRSVLWLGVFMLVPRRRAIARSKTRLTAWLTFRQLTNWRLWFRSKVSLSSSAALKGK